MVSNQTDLQLLSKVMSGLNVGDLERRAAGIELRARLVTREQNPNGDREWPVALYEAANRLFGGAVFNKGGRVHKAFNVKVQHAYRTWEDKYGPLTPEQAVYADELLVSCFVLRDAPEKPYPIVHTKLDRIVHHERTHAGFLRRSSFVNVSDVLAELE